MMIFTFFSWMLFITHDFVHAAFGMAIVGGLIPFFVMNVFSHKSKMFIGDAGTMMLGIAICEFVMVIMSKEPQSSRLLDENFCLIAFVMAVLAIPVFDTIRVMLGRIMRKRSPFRPDRSHLHHAFIGYGFRHLEASLLEILLNILIIFVWIVLRGSHLPMEWQLYGVVAASMTVTVGLFWMLVRQKKKREKAGERK